ncbi:hypothetical protein QFZ75_000120 [Streptomyces sp. V3I8]|nr:hypothetical protein [Streptomyces sp. V3I8]
MELLLGDLAELALLTHTRDEDVSSFINEQSGAGRRRAGRSAGDHRCSAIELSHDHSIELGAADNGGCGAFERPTCVLRVKG